MALVEQNAKTFAYPMISEECQLINALRRLGYRPLIQKLLAPLEEEDRRPFYDESARKVVDYIEAVLNEKTRAEQPAADIEEPTGNPPASNEQDSVLDSQNALEGLSDNQLRPEIWKSFRDKSIPTSVSEIIFKVAGEETGDDDSDNLRSRFPGVTLMYTSAATTESHSQALESRKQLRGIKSMVLELDEGEIATNPILENEVRERYPWATIQSGAGPNTSKKPGARSNDATATDGLDPIRHLRDLVEYTKSPPPTQDFHVYDPRIFENWDDVAPARKLEVAQARAIRAHYGKAVDGAGCGKCVEAGYPCRAYSSELHDLTSSISFGIACQYCRLRDIPCDLVPALKANTTEPVIASNARDDGADPNSSPAGSAGDLTTSFSAPLRPKPSLASRITTTDIGRRIRGAATVDVESEVSHRPNTSKEPQRLEDRITATKPPGIVAYAKSVRVDIPLKAEKTINHMYYTQLQRHREIFPYAPRTGTLEQYYQNLIIIYILLYKRQEYDLAYFTLLRFQWTNLRWTGKLPDIELGIFAFEHLPEHSPLCEWLIIMYSFLWTTENIRSFLRDRPDLQMEAFAKLLYGIAELRDPFTKGLDDALQSRWCDVHDHDNESEDLSLCESMRKEADVYPEEARKRLDIKDLADAQKTVKLHSASATVARRSEGFIHSSPASKDKRKAATSPSESRKKSKRGGAYGVGAK